MQPLYKCKTRRIRMISYKLEQKNIKNLYIRIKDKTVIVTAPKKMDKKTIEEIIRKKSKWINNKLKEEKEELQDKYNKEEFVQIIKKNIDELVKQTSLVPNKVRIREIKYAWGSCSSNKNITINMKLIKYDEEIIRYVILHELCHIKYMNHSKEFWKLVEMYMPNYKEIRRKIK